MSLEPQLRCADLASHTIFSTAANLLIMNHTPITLSHVQPSRPTALPSLAKPLAHFFQAKGIEAYLVGGVIRDSLLGRDAHDIDISVQGDAAHIGKELADALGGRCIRLHDDWEIVRIVLAGDVRERYVDLTPSITNIKQDLMRRDFSINAMALPIQAAFSDKPWGGVLDPCDAMQDLRDGIIRMTSPDVFGEDALRLMRAPRLAAQLGFTLDEQTASVISQQAPFLNTAAPERVRDELMKLLQAPNARDSVRLLDDLGLLCVIMPELADAKGVLQPKEHYWDVFNHLVECVGWAENLFSGDDADGVMSVVPMFDGIHRYFHSDVGDGFDRLTFLKLAALLHDVAKPTSKTIEDSGRIRFIGHHSEGADMAHQILTRLRFSNRGVQHIASMVQHHLRPAQLAQKGEMPTQRALYRYYRDVGDVAIDTLYLNTADYLAARGPLLENDEWTSHCELIGYILESGHQQHAPETLSRLINGYDIMEKFSLAPSPAIGRLLEMVQEAQASGDITTKAQALELVSSSIDRGGDGA